MKDIIFTKHAVTRMAERQISVSLVKEIIQNGEVIKDYPEDNPYPSKLILGYVELRPIHIVLSEHQDMNIIITAYEPELESWEADFKRRKS